MIKITNFKGWKNPKVELPNDFDKIHFIIDNLDEIEIFHGYFESDPLKPGYGWYTVSSSSRQFSENLILAWKPIVTLPEFEVIHPQTVEED